MGCEGFTLTCVMGEIWRGKYEVRKGEKCFDLVSFKKWKATLRITFIKKQKKEKQAEVNLMLK